jgi:hypothetical protein
VSLHRIPRQVEAPDVLALCDEDVHAAGKERGRKGGKEEKKIRESLVGKIKYYGRVTKAGNWVRERPRCTCP